jgi:hypothetical protein
MVRVNTPPFLAELARFVGVLEPVPAQEVRVSEALAGFGVCGHPNTLGR